MIQLTWSELRFRWCRLKWALWSINQSNSQSINQ